ncbi:hypothetical protein EF879_18265 [Micromonospora sp. HM5-17]|nr:hypothetical protein EF879_18265 [Micromonospora sp. HM5-17]
MWVPVAGGTGRRREHGQRPDGAEAERTRGDGRRGTGRRGPDGGAVAGSGGRPSVRAAAGR